MEDFIEMNESFLGEYVDLSAGCPSHDTLECVVSMVNPYFLKELKLSFETSSETTHFSKLIAVEDKSNEITAIPRLLHQLDLRKSIVTIDALGTQTDIVDVIIGGKGDY